MSKHGTNQKDPERTHVPIRVPDWTETSAGLVCLFTYVLTYGACVCREELCSFQREIEVLSEQYSQKCLENAHLAQALEAERQALRQCQRENQELNAHNQVGTRPSRNQAAWPE